MGARKNARAIRRHARGEGARSRARPFFLAPIYFLAPATQASGTLSKNTILLHLIQRGQPSNNFRNVKSKTNKRLGALSSKQNLLHSSCARSLARSPDEKHFFTWPDRISKSGLVCENLHHILGVSRGQTKSKG